MKGEHLLKKIFFIGMAGWMVIALSAFFVDTVGWAKTPAPYKFPKIFYWGGGDVGSTMYVVPAVMAEKIGPVLGSKIRLIPGNDVERINMLRMGKTHLSSVSADTYWASMGLAHYCTFALGPQPLRIVWSGWPYSSGTTGIASAASGIKTPYDLKGKRLVKVVGAAYSSEGIRASLAFANLTLNDATIIEVSSIGAAYKALTEGKGDYTIGSTSAPGVLEAEASPYGVFIVRFPLEDKEGWERYRKILCYQVPGYSTIGAGIKPGEKVPTPIYPHPITITPTSQSDEFVYMVCKAIYSQINEIAAAYAGNDAMRPERAIIPEATLMAPFHPGAIKFFKEVGIWKEAHEAANKKRLGHLEKLNTRWETFVEEAQERMTKTGKKVDLAKEWQVVVEKEIGLAP